MTPSLQTALNISAVGLLLTVIVLFFTWGATALLARAKPARPRVRPDPRVVASPITGNVASIAIHPGDTVGIGQELCIIETPESKTAVRAGRMGTIATIRVAPGDAVLPGQPLMDYSD